MYDDERKVCGFVISLKGIGVILLVTLIVYACQRVIGADSVKIPRDKKLINVPIEKIAAEFKKIRKVKGHFHGGKWNDEVDKWMGRKHRLMIELGFRLSNGRYHKSDIVKLLDQPDRVAVKGDDLFKRIISQPEPNSSKIGSYQLLVYYWRGTHDFLYFTCRNNIIVDSTWWNAGE